MTAMVNNFGKNAGKVWQALQTYGPQTPDKLMKATNLDEYNLYAALGWLAKENKVCKTGTKYQLGTTNLEAKVGTDAGKVWKTLHTLGYVDEPYLPKLAGVSNQDAYAALGWLAREGKIDTKTVKPKKPLTKYGLKY